MKFIDGLLGEYVLLAAVPDGGQFKVLFVGRYILLALIEQRLQGEDVDGLILRERSGRLFFHHFQFSINSIF